MTAVAVELLARPPEPVSVAEAGALLTLAGCRRIRRRHRYAAHDVRVQREQRPPVSSASSAALALRQA